MKASNLPKGRLKLDVCCELSQLTKNEHQLQKNWSNDVHLAAVGRMIMQNNEGFTI